MKLKAIITGSTGMIGKGLLLECIDSPHVESVLVINRSPVNIEHPKLKEIVHSDLSNLIEIEDEFVGYNVCFFCLGISASGISETEYKQITFDLTLNFAKTVLDKNPEISFCYISGAGTDSSEKGRTMWARVKGKTENALLKMNFRSAYMFRPALIIPMRGVKSRTKAYNRIYFVLKPLYPILKHLKRMVTNTEKLGKAMINVAMLGSEKKILENKDINYIADINK